MASATKRKSAIPQKRIPSSDSYVHFYHPLPVDDLDLDTQCNNPGLKKEKVMEEKAKHNKKADIMKNITDDDATVIPSDQFTESRTHKFDDVLFHPVTGTSEEIVEILASVNGIVQSASDIPLKREDGGSVFADAARANAIKNESEESVNEKLENGIDGIVKNTECDNWPRFITKDEIYEDIFSKRLTGNNSPSSDFSSSGSINGDENLILEIPQSKLMENVYYNDEIKLDLDKPSKIENGKCQVDEECTTGSVPGSSGKDKGTGKG